MLGVKDKIVVLLMKEEEKTKGGLIVPESAQQSLKPQKYGTVVTFGPEVEGIEMGDVLMFHGHAGMDIVLDEGVGKVLKFDEVYAVVAREVGE